MKIHRAIVEELVDEEGIPFFRASCLNTGKQCDAYAYADVTPDERERMNRSVEYLEDRSIHIHRERFCTALHNL